MDFKELNDKQIEAVKETEGYVRVIAGAGTGKTRVLVSRYLYLVSELGIDPDSILCMTFTKKARNEMVMRIKSALGEDLSLPYILTYHSFGSLFLRQEIKCLGYSHSFRIFDENDTKRVLEKIYQNHDMKLDSVSLEEMRTLITLEKKKEAYIPRMMNRQYESHILDKIKTMDDVIIDEYLLSQRQSRWLDFDDLITYTHYILKNHPDILKKWQDMFGYFEVDEAQDTSNIEYDILELLSSGCKNVFVVGDPDQNIYEWRDSDNRILLDYEKNHENCKTFILDENYRSTQNILDAANKLISHNQNRVKKDFIALKDEGEKVFFERMETEELTAMKISSFILESIQRKEDYKDNAILFRCGFYSLTLENILRKENIPYDVIGAPSFYEYSEIQDVVALIKIVFLEDDKSLLRMINKPSRKFGKKKVEYLLSMQRDETLFHTLQRHRNDIEFVGTEIHSFINAIEDAQKNNDIYNAYKTLNRLIEDLEYSDYLAKLKNPSHLENLNTFLMSIYNDVAINKDKIITLKDYYESTIKKREEEMTEKNAVSLLTIHASKGLEYKNVYIVGLDEPFFPHYKTLEDRKDSGLEEERRLLYVAMTRAKDRLYLFSEADIGDKNQPSRFISEIFENEKCYVKPTKKQAKEKKEKPKLAKKEKNVPNLFNLFNSSK